MGREVGFDVGTPVANQFADLQEAWAAPFPACRRK
jgi:hypothetical protein